MRVIIADPLHPEAVQRGESDLKRVDGMYYRIVRDGVTDKSSAMQLTPIVYVYREEAANMVQATLMLHKEDEKLLKDKQYRELMKLRKDYGA